MKKSFFLLSAGVLLIACNNEKKADDAPKNTDLIQQNLKGKVQQIAGKALGNKSLEARGGANQIAGKTQRAYGDAKQIAKKSGK